MIARTNVQQLRDALADRYLIEGELGRGGMATVYLAEDLKHQRRVAVKVLHAEHSAAVGKERFLREITTAANLTHPHIVPVFDSGEADGQLYFVMPLIEGETLRARLEREGPLPVEEAIRLVREVADGLEYAHGAGILHRDLKPENIMLSRGHALLADFGIAGSTNGASAQARLTQTGTSLGTAAYMSPEQATGERELGPPSDVYGLASVLYELLTGVAPFTGPTFQAILVKRFTQEAPSCSSRRADTPAGCDAAIARALAREPADRFASVRAFAEAIATAMTPAVAHLAATDRSIVVLPFANLSPDPDNEYFSDGLTEEIISDLSAVRALNVISRTSAMQLKGTTRDIRTLGRDLGVRYVLEGGVRKAGTRLRITAQLIDARTDHHLWTEKFSGTMDDIFEVQERVSREIVNALNVTLTPDEDHRLAARPVRDARAYDLYLRARQALRRYGPEIDRGLAMVEEAIAIEGATPPLRGLRALAWVYMARSGWKPELQPLDLADRETQALLTIAPEAAYTQALAGFVAYQRGDLRAAVRALRLANEREPGDPDVLFFLGIALGAAGQAEAQLDIGEEWLATDPLASMAWVLAGAARWFVGRIEEAASFMERALELEPESVFIPWGLGYTYAMLGRIDQADVHAEWLMTHAPQMPYAPHLKSLVLSLQGRQDEARAILDALDTSGLDGHQSWHLAESFALAGAHEQALCLLDQAIERGNYLHEWFERRGPFFEPLRGDPEFARIVARAAQRKAEFAA
jgi:eukaryotic-like serine/threonine-protein kinase